MHHAHSRGLLTYFTGGVTCPDIQPAVLGGVDGVGVGGVGMLHHPDTGRNSKEKHGPYMEENIPQVGGDVAAAAVAVGSGGRGTIMVVDLMVLMVF